MKIFTRFILFPFYVLIVFIAPLAAQEDFQKWYHLGSSGDFPTGVRAEEWYQHSTNVKPKTVIVAVLDSGVEVNHPDLKDNIWVNPKEIPGNQKDDDNNGYIDDTHGWNFLGGPDGRSVINESLEVTRQYALEKEKWGNVDPEGLKGKKKREYAAFLEKKEIVETKRADAMEQISQVDEMAMIVTSALDAAKMELKDDSLDIDLLEKSANEEVQLAARIIRSVEEQGVPVESIDWLIEVAMAQFEEQKASAEKVLQFSYNTSFDSREIVGDTYSDFGNRSYGNNNVDGEFSYHGTHVSGIIGAVRGNDEGMEGIADHVAIMGIKVVPDGDERDKDVANGIRYAVDNGAQVVNMSFGKGYSPEKFLVDDAMQYAARHDVLLVLGAGNDGKDVDKLPKYPSDAYQKKPLFGPKRAPNLIAVGALSPEGGEQAIAEFSNYGKKDVDVFAPGVYIYSTTPDSTYNYASGTSMAAPVVSGVAALIRSRYPDLSAKQVKEIIIKSSRKLPASVIQPGTFDTVPGDELCTSGGMVDVVSAMNLAAVTKGKAKKKNRIAASEYVPAGGKA